VWPISVLRIYIIPVGVVYVMYLNTPAREKTRRKAKGKSYSHQQLQVSNFSDIRATVGAESHSPGTQF